MINFIYGAVGALLVLAILGGGFLLGWKGHKKFTERAKVAAESQFTEEQVKQFKADKVAFDTMLAYNAATAYGVDRKFEELIKDDD